MRRFNNFLVHWIYSQTAKLKEEEEFSKGAAIRCAFSRLKGTREDRPPQTQSSTRKIGAK
jgi:hypothetical protein